MIEIEHDIKCQTMIIVSLIDKAVGSFLAPTQGKLQLLCHSAKAAYLSADTSNLKIEI